MCIAIEEHVLRRIIGILFYFGVALVYLLSSTILTLKSLIEYFCFMETIQHQISFYDTDSKCGIVSCRVFFKCCHIWICLVL